MSAPNTLATPTRRRTIIQGAKLAAKPLANFIGMPGVQEFVHNAQELIMALKVGYVWFLFLATEADAD